MSAARGWLCLLGGGEFSFGETEEADRAWLGKTPPGVVGFVPAASGSVDYGHHFASYMKSVFDREVETIPIYRPRDARRGRNAERVASSAAVYIGGGVADHLVEAIAATPIVEALAAKLAAGGVVVAIAAAAQACGRRFRSVAGGAVEPGLGLFDGVVETNFDPAHDRRLRKLVEGGSMRGLGIPSGGAFLVRDGGEWASVGPIFELTDADGDLEARAARTAIPDDDTEASS